jgi:hypothetical protein
MDDRNFNDLVEAWGEDVRKEFPWLKECHAGLETCLTFDCHEYYLLPDGREAFICTQLNNEEAIKHGWKQYCRVWTK